MACPRTATGAPGFILGSRVESEAEVRALKEDDLLVQERSRTTVREIIHLAVPVILAELGWMLMGVADTIMVGPVGPAAIGAVSIGNAVFDVTAIFGIGLLLGLDT